MNISDLLNPATDDILTIKCRNHLLTLDTDKHKIASPLLNSDCRLDTVELRNEVCRRYESAGELRIIHPNYLNYSSMSRDISKVIRR
jgi:hypothetical protein